MSRAHVNIAMTMIIVSALIALSYAFSQTT